MEHRIGLANGGKPSHEVDQLLMLISQSPIDQTDFIVLAIGVVIPFLRARELLACEHVAHLPQTKRTNRGIIRLSFHTRLPPVTIRFPYPTLFRSRRHADVHVA